MLNVYKNLQSHLHIFGAELNLAEGPASHIINISYLSRLSTEISMPTTMLVNVVKTVNAMNVERIYK